MEKIKGTMNRAVFKEVREGRLGSYPREDRAVFSEFCWYIGPLRLPWFLSLFM